MNPRGFLRRLAPRDPRDYGRYVFIAACCILAAVLVAVLLATGHGG